MEPKSRLPTYLYLVLGGWYRFFCFKGEAGEKSAGQVNTSLSTYYDPCLER